MHRISFFFLFCSCVVPVTALQAQHNFLEQNVKDRGTIPKEEGSFAVDLRHTKLSSSAILPYFNEWLGLTKEYSFRITEEQTDQLAFTHQSYAQWYKGVRIEDGMVLLHERGNKVISMNGRVGLLAAGFSVVPQLQVGDALTFAEKQLLLLPGYQNGEPELVITNLPAQKEKKYMLAYKILREGRQAADSSFVRMHVFIDAQNGAILNILSLIAHISAPGTAQTLYSGLQNIIVDGDEIKGYRLFDSLRNITTLNFEKAIVSSNGTASNMLEYTNKSTTWDSIYCLDSVSLSKAGDTDLFPATGRWRRMLQIVGGTSSQFAIQGPFLDLTQSSKPNATFSNIALGLTSPPYTFTIEGYNSSKKVTSGFAFFTMDSMDIQEGIHPWSDSLGNEGYYTIRRRPNPALDAHWGMERTYDFYKEVFKRNSYNDRGGEIINLVNGAYVYSGTQSNAAALGNGYMVFGLGDRNLMSDVVSLDVAGHEFSHMVTSDNGHGGLAYQGESGALNESFSDILGTCIEFYAKGQDANWTIGEDIFLRAPGMFRSMSHPKSTAGTTSLGQPDTYQGQYWVDPANIQLDNGGVHVNSGVQNKWFYLLCEGGTGTNDNGDAYLVNGIGIEKAQQIVYRNLIHYLTPYAQFLDACKGSLQATEDLYGSAGEEYSAVKAAWFAVGIGGSTAITPLPAITKGVKIYPNPASDEIFITSERNDVKAISLLNMLGVVARNVAIQQGENVINIASLPKGLYLVRYSINGSSEAQILSIR